MKRGRFYTAQQLASEMEDCIKEYLGEYCLLDANGNTLATAPAVWISPPQLPNNRKVKTDSGIELIVHRSPQVSQKQNAGLKGVTIKHIWQVFLVQYDRRQTTLEATQLLLSQFPYTTVTTRPQMQTKEGLVYEQARVNVPEWVFQR